MSAATEADSEGDSRVERIGRAAAALLARGRSSDVTVRAVAERAGVSAATVQRDYPSRSLLLERGYALALVADSAHAAAVAALPHPAPDDDLRRLEILEMRLGAQLHQGLDTVRARFAALLAQARATETGTAAAARRWRLALLERQGELGFDPEGVNILCELMIGLELLSLGCRNHPLLNSMNRELLAHGVAIAGGRWTASTPPWFVAATQDLVNRHRGAEAAGSDTGRKRRGRTLMLEGARQIVMEQGFGALTHRSVAARSGAALSHVSKEFPTAAQLLHALYHDIHAELFHRTVASGEKGLGATASFLADGALTHLLSMEATLFAASETELAAAAWDMRVARGAIMLRKSPAPDRVTPEDFDSHFVSIWSVGALLLLPILMDPASIEQGFRRRIDSLLERMPGLRS